MVDLLVGQVIWNPNGLSFAALDKTNLVFVFPQEHFFDQTSMLQGASAGGESEDQIGESVEQDNGENASDSMGTQRM